MTVQVVGVAGDVDLTTRALLAHGLTHAKDQTPPGPDPTRRVVVDVTAMTFCGAAGLGLLALAADHSRRTGTVWALAGLTPRLTRLLATLWPTARPALYRDRATAITAVGLGDPLADPRCSVTHRHTPAPPLATASTCKRPADIRATSGSNRSDLPDRAGRHASRALMCPAWSRS